MTITENRPPQVDWDKQRRKKRRRRLDTVDAGLVLVAAVLLGVGSHLFTDSLFRNRADNVAAVVPETLPSTTLPTTGIPTDLALNPGIDGSVTGQRTMTVTGTATAGASVRIGGLRTTAQSDGSWAIAVLLQPGVNALTVESSVGDASPTVQKFTVTYTPSTTPSTPVAPTVGTATTTDATTAATTVPTTAGATSTTRARPATTVSTIVPDTEPAPPTTPPIPPDTGP